MVHSCAKLVLLCLIRLHSYRLDARPRQTQQKKPTFPSSPCVQERCQNISPFPFPENVIHQEARFYSLWVDLPNMPVLQPSHRFLRNEVGGRTRRELLQATYCLFMPSLVMTSASYPCTSSVFIHDPVGYSQGAITIASKAMRQ